MSKKAHYEVVVHFDKDGKERSITAVGRDDRFNTREDARTWVADSIINGVSYDHPTIDTRECHIPPHKLNYFDINEVNDEE